MENNYLDDGVIATMVTELNKKGRTGRFLSSDPTNSDYFSKSKIPSLKLISLSIIPADTRRGIAPWVRVNFESGHMMSFNKFATARGISWPVIGLGDRLQLINNMLKDGKELPTFVPASVKEDIIVFIKTEKGNRRATTEEADTLRAEYKAWQLNPDPEKGEFASSVEGGQAFRQVEFSFENVTIKDEVA